MAFNNLVALALNGHTGTLFGKPRGYCEGQTQRAAGPKDFLAAGPLEALNSP